MLGILSSVWRSQALAATVDGLLRATLGTGVGGQAVADSHTIAEVMDAGRINAASLNPAAGAHAATLAACVLEVLPDAIGILGDDARHMTLAGRTGNGVLDVRGSHAQIGGVELGPGFMLGLHVCSLSSF